MSGTEDVSAPKLGGAGRLEQRLFDLSWRSSQISVPGGYLQNIPDDDARHIAAVDAARLAAIVASSDDAIISKTLDGCIVTWNAGAERIFGYAAEEMIGRPILTLIPAELRHEEDSIIARLKRGERIEHFETVRVRKDGKRINVSIAISPVRDANGRIVGASKVARDITERKQADELQRLLFDELNHRVKNMLATIQAIAGQSLRRSASPADFVTSFNGRVQALSRAHDLLVQRKMRGAEVMEIVREQILLGAPDPRITVSGPLLVLEARVAVQLALVLHELATNARKYGALSVPGGRLAIEWAAETGESRQLRIVWRESGVPHVRPSASRGFGTTLIERTLAANGGTTTLAFTEDGVVCIIVLPLGDEAEETVAPRERCAAVAGAASGLKPELAGKRVLLIEDEPLIAMELEDQLNAAGCRVVGPAATVESANRLILGSGCDAALLDANLGGQRVDSVAALLRELGIPFAFATGYGAEALPRGFETMPILAKPYDTRRMLDMLCGLLAARA